MPHTLRSVELADEVTAELTMLVGFDQDLADEANRTSSRIRGLLTQFDPSLERVLGPCLDHPAVTWLLERYGSPDALRKAGRRKLVEVIRPRARARPSGSSMTSFTALDEQTVVVPGTTTLDVIVPSFAKSLAVVHEPRRALEDQIESLLEAHPLAEALTSKPGVGVRTAAVLLVTVGDGSSFPSAAHLASYAGLAPTAKSHETNHYAQRQPQPAAGVDAWSPHRTRSGSGGGSAPDAGTGQRPPPCPQRTRPPRRVRPAGRASPRAASTSTRAGRAPPPSRRKMCRASAATMRAALPGSTGAAARSITQPIVDAPAGEPGCARPR